MVSKAFLITRGTREGMRTLRTRLYIDWFLRLWVQQGQSVFFSLSLKMPEFNSSRLPLSPYHCSINWSNMQFCSHLFSPFFRTPTLRYLFHCPCMLLFHRVNTGSGSLQPPLIECSSQVSLSWSLWYSSTVPSPIVKTGIIELCAGVLCSQSCPLW